jgi:hypothetical protein
MWEQVIYWMRLANVIIGVIAFTWFLIKSSSAWSKYESSFRRYAMALAMYAFASLYSSGEAWAQGAPPGLRSVLILLANGALLHALWQMRGHHYDVRRHRH